MTHEERPAEEAYGPPSKTVAVFGAGISGLTVAHELATRGYRVQVYEANSEAGGFFRSARCLADCGMPSEYSWHGMGPWYHNVFDLLKQIPWHGQGSLYDKVLSRPIDIGLATDDGHVAFNDTWWVNVKNMFSMTWPDVVWGSWLMLKTWVSDERSQQAYSQQNAASAWRPYLSDRAWRSWRSCFGPWIGSDWTNVSLHTAGQFFRKQLASKANHAHPADEQGPAWQHRGGDGWLLLRGPSSEYWFDHWILHLRNLGVTFHWQQPLQSLKAQ